MEENEYRQMYRAAIPQRCVFEKAVLLRHCACSQARHYNLAEREAVACESAAGREQCEHWLNLLRAKAVFVLQIRSASQAQPNPALPHAKEVLEALSGRHRLVLITKGDLFDQERKLAASGLGDYFDAVEIVSDKSRGTYQRIFAAHGDGPDHAMMIGNSLKSDVIPAIEAGAWGVFVPHDLTWSHEHADEPDTAPRFRKIPHLGEIEAVLAEIG